MTTGKNKNQYFIKSEKDVKVALAAAKKAVPNQPSIVYDWWKQAMKVGTIVTIHGNKVEDVTFYNEEQPK